MAISYQRGARIEHRHKEQALRELKVRRTAARIRQEEYLRNQERAAIEAQIRRNLDPFGSLSDPFESNLNRPTVIPTSRSRSSTPSKPKKYILAPTIKAAKKAIKSMNFSKEPEILTAEQTKYIRDCDTVILVQGERFKKALKNITPKDLRTYYCMVKDMYYVKAHKSIRQSRSNEYLIKAKSYEAKYNQLKDGKGPTKSFLDFTGLKSIFS